MVYNEQEEALIFANDRPTSLGDDLYQWALDAEDMIRSLYTRVQELEKMNLLRLDVISNLANEGMKREEKLGELEAENSHLKDAAWTAIDALGATQAQRVPLSEDTIKGCLEGEVRLPNGWLRFARAIEARHGITQEKQG